VEIEEVRQSAGGHAVEKANNLVAVPFVLGVLYRYS